MSRQWEEVVIGALEPASLGHWWARALGWVVNDASEEFEIRPSPDQVPGLLFRSGGSACWSSGATLADIGQSEQPWTVMADPEGDVCYVLAQTAA